MLARVFTCALVGLEGELVEVEVDRLVMLETVVLATEYNWLPLMASVLLALTRPAATFWIRRSVPGAMPSAACAASARNVPLPHIGS